MKIAMVVDVSNLYYSLKHKFGHSRLAYPTLIDYIGGMGTIIQMHAFGTNKDNEAASFIHALVTMGFTPHFKAPKEYKNLDGVKHKSDWDVGMAICMVNLCKDDTIDTIMLCSADGDLTPAVEYVRKHRRKVIILACGISRELAEAANEHMEIPKSFLETRNG